MTRLGLFVGILVIVALAVLVGGVIDFERDEMQREIREFGPLAPVIFVLVSGVLGALFVPGPVFAILASALFGPLLGIPLGIAGSVVCALICREVGSHMGRDAAEEIAGARLGQLTTWLDRYGLLAVIGFRLMPAMPDAPLNYAAGLTRLKRWQIGLGTAIGVIPRTLGWGLVGATVGGGSAWLATAGGALIIGADAGGAIAAIFAARYLGISPRMLWAKLRGAPAEPHAHGPTGKGRWGAGGGSGGRLGRGKVGHMRIAIDGPAGAGKSTVARLVAERLEFTYLDTGAMYRCAALASLRGEAAPGEIEIDFAPDGEVLLAGEDVTLLIRSPEVTSLASKVAAEPSVRAGLVERQRELMAHGDWVAEGRDVGTVVVPDAELKVFLDADPLERAQRRAAQLGADVNEVLAQQNERDERDRTREAAPLKAADDAVILDTTGLSIEQVVDQIAALATSRTQG
ncbi:MAG: (d)CMP kinase [Solirubrobacteraceae bacterium]|nr:(d)CMP kinase [Solirubrobacteraceae bacterium]